MNAKIRFRVVHNTMHRILVTRLAGNNSIFQK